MTNPANNTNNNSHDKARLEQQEQGRFVLTGGLNFQTVPEVWQQSKTLFAGAASVTVDLSGVSHCNSAGLALLIEWLRAAKSQNQSVSFQNLPEQMQDIARVCGVADKLPG